MPTDQDSFLPPDPTALGPSGADPQDPESAAGSALGTHHDRLMALPGVVMLGETLDAVGRPAILIGVRSQADLPGLPIDIDGHPVVAQVIGDVDAL